MKNSCSGIKKDWCCKAFALTGRLAEIAIIPRAMPWARGFCPFRACCFWGFCPLPFPSAGDRWFRACCLRLACILLLLFPSAEEIKMQKAEM